MQVEVHDPALGAKPSFAHVDSAHWVNGFTALVADFERVRISLRDVVVHDSYAYDIFLNMMVPTTLPRCTMSYQSPSLVAPPRCISLSITVMERPSVEM